MGNIISFDAKTAFAVLLLAFASILVGLLLAAVPYLRVPEPERPKPQWVASIFLFSLSLPIFGWMAITIEDFSKPSFVLSTIANLLFFVASCLQADFYRSLNLHRRQTSKIILLPILIIIYVPIFEWARDGTLDTRIIVSGVMWELAIIWQIYELSELRNNNESINISYLFVIAIAEFLCGAVRIFISVTNEFEVTFFHTITKYHFIFAILQVFLTILSYFGVSKYWTERTIRNLTIHKLESDKIRGLIEGKEKILLKLLASNKTAASGALSATVIHEITQPLTALSLRLSNAMRLATEKDKSSEIKTELIECKKCTEKISDIVNTIRLIFSGNAPSFEEINLAKIAHEVKAIAKVECETYGIDFFCPAQLPVIAIGNAMEVQHIVLNLVLNAIDSLKKSPESKKEITINAFTKGKKAHIEVIDTGAGVGETIEDKLFTILESTKNEGMGIGLWLCKQIADRNKGNIFYKKNVPSGAVFELVLPR